jgi:hypothetical protein
MIKPPTVDVEETSCETRTRVLRPLGGLCMEEPDEPHERKITPTITRMISRRTVLFKPKAPNDMKTGDLSAKSWIITDWELLISGPAQH